MKPQTLISSPGLGYSEGLGSLQEKRVPQHFIRSHIPMSGISPQSLPLGWADQEDSAEPLRASEQRLEPELCPGHRVLTEAAAMRLLASDCLPSLSRGLLTENTKCGLIVKTFLEFFKKGKLETL